MCSESGGSPPDALREARTFPIQHGEPIPWTAAEKAYQTYAKLYGRQQSLERLAERGGFGLKEWACLYLGHDADEYHYRNDADRCVMQALRAALSVPAPTRGEPGEERVCVNPGDPENGVPPLYLTAHDRLCLAQQALTLGSETYKRAVAAARAWENLWRRENGLPPVPSMEDAQRIIGCPHARGFDASGCCFDCGGYNPAFALSGLPARPAPPEDGG